MVFFQWGCLSVCMSRWWQVCDLWLLCSAVYSGAYLWWVQLRLISGSLCHLWWTRRLWCLLLQRVHDHWKGCKCNYNNFCHKFMMLMQPVAYLGYDKRRPLHRGGGLCPWGWNTWILDVTVVEAANLSTFLIFENTENRIYLCCLAKGASHHAPP